MLLPCATVELIWQDESGTQSATVLNVPISYTAEEAFDRAESAVSAFSALTGAVLVGIRLKYRFGVDERLPAGGSTPITETGVFFFSAGASAPDAGVVVHSLKPEVLLSSGPAAGIAIDLANAAVETFADAVLSLPCSNPFGNEFVSLFAAYRQSRV